MKIFILLLFIIPTYYTNLLAQTTADFESATAGATSFSSNGQNFNIFCSSPSAFSILSASGIGWNGTAIDNKFIDNSNTSFPSQNIEFTIAAAGGTAFTLKSVYLFLSQYDLNQVVSGSVTITGKLLGSTVFTATANSGFNADINVNNGYSFINMTTFGGSDNSFSVVDEYTVTTTGNIEYVGLDAMTWRPPCATIAGPSVLTNQSFCSNKTVADLVATGTGTFNWFAAASGGQALDASTIIATGNYYVSETNAEGCRSDRTMVAVIINALPAATTIIGGNVSICQDTSVVLTAVDNLPNNTYTWQRAVSRAANSVFLTFGGNARTQAIVTSGIYRVIVNNEFNCSSNPSPTVSVNKSDFLFSGSLSTSDATQTGRINRLSTSSTCGAASVFPGTLTTVGARFYDSYNVSNPRSVAICAKIGVKSNCGGNIFSVTYLNSFNPSNLATNYLGDSGESFSIPTAQFYEVTIPANGTIVVVVHAVGTGVTCNNYEMSVELPREIAGITVTPNSAVCASSTAALQASLADSYLWNDSFASRSRSINPAPTATTTYNVTLGYGNRSCTAVVQGQVLVNQPAVPTFTQVAPICINSPLAALPTTSLNGISGTWSPALNNSATTTYTFSPTAGACATTATMTIVVKTVQGDPSVFGAGQWNVYAWNSGGAGATAGAWNLNYSGFYSVSGLNFDSRQQWDVLGSPSDATNYQGCPIAVDNHSWSAKRQGFPVKYYKINIDNHDDQADLLVNGILVWQHVGCCDAHPNAWQGNLGLNDTVEFRVTDGGSASLGAISFEEYFPRPTITANGTTSICAGSNVVLTSSSADSYLWSTGQTTQSITVSTAGNYTVQATIGAQNNASVATVVLVNPIIAPTFTQISPICSGASLSALATRSNNGIDGTWSPVINNVATTTYLFTPVASACANAVTLTIIVNPQPPQPVIACYQTASFNTATCAWVISGNQSVQPTLACYQTANFDTTSCAWVISGVQPQNPIISFNGNVLTSNIIGTSYQWFILNNSGVFVPIVGANSLNYTAVENGSYRVEVVAANCTLTSNTFTSTTLFNESFEKEGVSFYPNPFETIFNIVINENAEATITDVFGKQIAFQNLISGTNTIDLSGRAAGVYFVKIRTANGNKTIKMIKK